LKKKKREMDLGGSFGGGQKMEPLTKKMGNRRTGKKESLLKRGGEKTKPWGVWGHTGNWVVWQRHTTHEAERSWWGEV